MQKFVVEVRVRGLEPQNELMLLSMVLEGPATPERVEALSDTARRSVRRHLYNRLLGATAPEE